MFANFIKTPVVLKTGHNILQDIDKLLTDAHVYYPHKVLLTQENLYEAYREQLECNSFDKVIFIQGGSVEEAIKTMAKCRDLDAVLLAFGGGSVLDTVKYCASTLDKPYITIPSALSNDAIYSTVARLTKNGTKTSFDVQSPMGILVDVDIIADSPEELILSGIADLVSNLSAIQDWLLSYRNTGEPINELAYMLAKECVFPVMRYEKKDLHSVNLILDLTNGLITSGLAMSVSGNSRGASGSEHMISHAIDKFFPERATLHGLQVGWAHAIIEKRYRNDEFGIIPFFDKIGLTALIAEKVQFTEEEFDTLIPLALKLRKRYTILNTI